MNINQESQFMMQLQLKIKYLWPQVKKELMYTIYKKVIILVKTIKLIMRLYFSQISTTLFLQ